METRVLEVRAQAIEVSFMDTGLVVIQDRHADHRRRDEEVALGMNIALVQEGKLIPTFLLLVAGAGRIILGVARLLVDDLRRLYQVPGALHLYVFETIVNLHYH